MAGLGHVPGRTVIYDLGGGTFDCVLAFDAGGGPGILGDPFGLPQIGGRAFDDRILHHSRETFAQVAKIFAADADDAEVLRRRIQLREKCVRAKIQLSFITFTEDMLSELDPPEMLELDRAVLAGMIDDLVEQTVAECERMLHSLNRSWPDVDQCVLIGGSSRVPLVEQRMRIAPGARCADSRNQSWPSSGARPNWPSTWWRPEIRRRRLLPPLLLLLLLLRCRRSRSGGNLDPTSSRAARRRVSGFPPGTEPLRGTLSDRGHRENRDARTQRSGQDNVRVADVRQDARGSRGLPRARQ